MAEVKLVNVCKVYNGKNKVKAVSDFTMDIKDNEFIVFVGPSGCGKSTTLRMIAGLEEITSGEIYIDDKLVNTLPPKDRDIAMVFQNYALYPHMTVYENMAFGLKMRHVKKNIIDEKIHEAAKLLEIEEYLDRKPKELSGGQMQRVALGRAIVRNPKVFLLDEPLSNLDAKLRTAMRVVISSLYQKLKTTFIYVTHDQTEAMTMGTRIVVLKDGVIQQIDSPVHLYEHPKNKFVAGFIGTPQMNFLPCVAKIEGENIKFDFDNGDNLVFNKNDFTSFDQSYFDGEHKILFGIRPEHACISDDKEHSIKGSVHLVEDLGNEKLIYTQLKGFENDRLGEANFICKTIFKINLAANDDVYYNCLSENVHLFDAETEMSIYKEEEAA